MAPLPPTRERPVVFNPPGLPGAPAGLPAGMPQPPRRGKRILKLALFTLVIILAIVLGMAAAAAYFAKQEIDELLTPKSAAVKQAQKQLKAPLPGSPANILILGSDHRKGFATTDRRSDTMLLVRLDPDGKTVSMLSFPRDLYVEIPGHGMSKINDAYTYGGPELSVKTVKQLTGLDVNFIVNVDFKGFRGIVDTLGGVYVDVDQRYLNDRERGGGNYAEIDIQPGYQLLRGRDALDFARFRHTDSDFHRIARQQQMLTAMKKQASSSGLGRKVPALFRVIKRNTDMAVGGEGELSVREVYKYISLALTLEGRDVYQVDLEGNIGTAGAASIVEADQSRIDAAVAAFLEPDASARDKTVDQVTGEKAGAAAEEPAKSASPVNEIPPSRITVEVRNGNGVAGAATEAVGILREAGYSARVEPGEAGNADNQNYANTRVQYNSERFKASAEKLAESLDGATVEKSTPANRFNSRLLVIVGRTGVPEVEGADTTEDEGSTETHAVNKVPEKSTPKVTVDPEYGRDDFQAIRGTLKVPVLYPTVREQTSTYDTLDDGGTVRTYQITKGQSVYDAYRLVGKTAGGDYWGLQGTNWPDPPILDDPTREVIRGGRTYQLYFNGTKLHLVAWRQGAGVYWVSNSVLDKLSNETMLAIAQGVKVVRG